MFYRCISICEEFPELKEHSDAPKLLVYLPDNLSEMGRENDRRPCLLICPGGAYSMCSQREAEPIALQFMAEGYNVFVLKYSGLNYHNPAQVREAAAAMELIYRNQEQWHCDVEHIAIMGFSAGGHLAAYYTNAYDCADVRAVFPDSKPVQATLLGYPVITAEPQWAHLGSFDNLTGKTERTQEEIDRLSCEKLVSNQTPPAFLWHTAADALVPVMNSLLYAQSLAAHGIPFELHVYPYGYHGLSTCDEQTCDDLRPEERYAHVWMECAKKWLKLVFQPTDADN